MLGEKICDENNFVVGLIRTTFYKTTFSLNFLARFLLFSNIQKGTCYLFLLQFLQLVSNESDAHSIFTKQSDPVIQLPFRTL